MKADLHEPRVLCLSWQPPSTDAAAPLSVWVTRFKQRLKVLRMDKHQRLLELVDMRAAAQDKAMLREGCWTDFIALFTVDYCLDCADRGDNCELQDALRQHQESGLAMWLLRMELGDPAEFFIGDRPLLHSDTAWTVLPAPDPAPPLVTTPGAMDDDMVRNVIEPVRAHCRNA